MSKNLSISQNFTYLTEDS